MAVPRWLRLSLCVAIAYKAAYHARYVGEDPFALVTFSDGRVYETMARDLLVHPPWGTEPFWLQGAYAAFMALAMAIGSHVSAALVLQLLVVALAWWGLFRALAFVSDRTTAGVAVLVAMLYPGLGFYENKYLTAALGCASLVAMLLAAARLARRPSAGGLVLFGVASGLAVLMRGNLLLALPFAGVTAVLLCPGSRGRTLATFGFGVGLALAPMLVRNAIVTGEPSIMPAHGGGTSFYIGNNAHARGVWNDAGGLLSGDVAHERTELAQRLELPPGDDAAIGRALYRRAWNEIAADPWRWLRLEGRKVWLLVGNDELAQDYDVLGEREIVGSWLNRGPPFGLLLALAGATIVGAWGRPRDRVARAWTWLCAGQALAIAVANVLYFTSAQHRVPLAVPLVAWVAWARPDRAWRDATVRRRIAMAVVAIALAGLAAWPRSKQREPSAVHDYDLALALVELQEPEAAMASLDRAVEKRPDSAIIRLERARHARSLGDAAKARADLAALARLPAPPWVRAQAEAIE